MKINNAKRWAKSGLEGYFAAFCGVCIAFAIRYTLHPFLQGSLPMTFFILNTIIIALFYGFRPSLLTIAISIPLAFFFFVPPFDSFEMPTAQDSFVFCSYILIAFIAVAIVEWLQRERYKAVLISRVSSSNFQMLSQASAYLKKERDTQKSSF